MRLALLTLYSSDIEKAKAFYEQLGIAFTPEKHGNGPMHYAGTMEGLVLEIYPTKHSPGKVVLEIEVDDLEALVKKLDAQQDSHGWNTRDPDGKLIYLKQYARA
jgi:hypothetical protein